MENYIFWSEIGSGIGESGGTPPPRIPKSTSQATQTGSPFIDVDKLLAIKQPTILVQYKATLFFFLRLVSSDRPKLKKKRKKNMLRVCPSRAPVLSCADYFQAPATH